MDDPTSFPPPSPAGGAESEDQSNRPTTLRECPVSPGCADGGCAATADARAGNLCPAERRYRLLARAVELERGKLAAVIDSMTQGVAIADDLGRVMFMNPAALRLHGLASMEEIGAFEAYWSQCRTHASDGVVVYADERPLALAVRGRATHDVELHVEPAAGRAWVGSWSCTPVRDGGGAIAFIVVTVQDITGQKRSEEALQGARLAAERARADAEAANNAKGQFLAVLSHELRTPLTPVLSAAQMLERDASLSGQARELAQTIRRNVQLEARLIDDLLDLTGIARGKLQLHRTTIDAHLKVREIVAFCREDIAAKQLELVEELAAADHHVLADGARFQQIVWNLLKNAVKFTPAGRVIVRSDNPGPGRLRLQVIDQGVGIDPAVLPRLFDAFEQGDRRAAHEFGGLGLGLAISKSLTELHGGVLTGHSDGPNRGATFAVELPTHAPAAGTPEPPGAAAGANAHGEEGVPGSILVVDDHPDTLRIMARILRGEGYRVLTAEDVASALQVAAAEEFDLLLSDVGLPDGTGLDLMRQLRAMRPVKGIALSGFGMDEDIQKSRDAGFDEHLTKPVDMDRLLQTISRTLEAQGAGSRE